MTKETAWLQDIQVIGWDLDGTLYKSGMIPLHLLEEARIKAVMDVTGWPPDKTRKEMGRLYEQVKSWTKVISVLGVNGDRFSEEWWDTFPLEEYLHHDQQLVEMFAALSGYEHFILSNSNRADQIERKITLLGLKPDNFRFFMSTIGMETKPSPRPFLACLERLAVPAETVLYVGDRVETDVLGAHRVGMKAALVWNTDAEAGEVADLSFETVYDVAEIVAGKEEA